LKEKRRAPRISSRIRSEFLEKNRVEAITLNVSRNGIFVQTDAARPLNSLVRLKVYIPPDQRTIEIFGRVARKGTFEDKSGIGIHFLELASADREAWLSYVALVEKLNAGSTDSLSPSAPLPRSERRSSPRTSASFMVRFKSTQRLEEFVSQNLSEGGMFLATPVLKPVGERIQVVVIHPTSAKDFEIEAEVIRINEEPTEDEPKGMALKFISLNQQRQAELKTFLAG